MQTLFHRPIFTIFIVSDSKFIRRMLRFGFRFGLWHAYHIVIHDYATRWNHKCVNNDKNATKWYMYLSNVCGKRKKRYAISAMWQKQALQIHLSFSSSRFQHKHTCLRHGMCHFFTTDFHFVTTLFLFFVVVIFLSNNILDWTWHVFTELRNLFHFFSLSLIHTHTHTQILSLKVILTLLKWRGGERETRRETQLYYSSITR